MAEDASPSVASVPPRSIACPAPDGVVALAPGGYAQGRLIALNDVLGGGCDRATVSFQPGVHVLDVNNPRRAAGDRHALVISDPDVRVVGGVPKGWGSGWRPGRRTSPRRFATRRCPASRTSPV